MPTIIPYVFRPESLTLAKKAPVTRPFAPQLSPAGTDQVQFSGKRKSKNAFGAQPTPALRFGAIQLYDGPYNNIRLITDFNDGTSNAEAERLFQDVLSFTQKTLKSDTNIPGTQWDPRFLRGEKGILQTHVIQDIPDRNRDFAALSLLRLGGGRPNRDIFVHVADPGVGDPSTRTILTTEKHGIYVGPNNGTLGLLIEQLQHTGESFELLQIDFDKVAAIERLRLNDPEYQIPVTFHGRDVFVVVAGAIAGGINPKSLGKPNPVAPVFAEGFTPKRFQPQPGKTVEVYAVRDNTAGNLKLNIALTQAQFNNLLQSGGVFRFQNPVTSKTLSVPVKNTFSEVDKGQPLFYLGSTYAPDGKSRFLELAINHGDISKALGVDGKNGAKQLLLTEAPV